MELISIENLKKNLNIGWIILMVYLALMAIGFVLANPKMPTGAEIYATILVLLIIGLSLKG